MIYAGNTVEAAGYDATPAQSGAHSYSSDKHTLTWVLVDENGQATQPESRATCVRSF